MSDDYIAWSATRKLTVNDFIIVGTSFIKELNEMIVSDMAKRRIDYDTETKFGNDAAKQAEWENEIWIELKGLKEFGRE